MEHCSDLFKANEDADLLTALRTGGQSGERARVDEISVKFHEHAEQLTEVRSRVGAGGKDQRREGVAHAGQSNCRGGGACHLKRQERQKRLKQIRMRDFTAPDVVE